MEALNLERRDFSWTETQLCLRVYVLRNAIILVEEMINTAC